MTHTNSLPSDDSTSSLGFSHLFETELFQDISANLPLEDEQHLNEMPQEFSDEFELDEAPELGSAIASTPVASLFLAPEKQEEPLLFEVPISFVEKLDPEIIKLHTQLFGIMGEQPFMSAYGSRVRRIQQAYDGSLTEERQTIARKKRVVQFAENVSNASQDLDGIAAMFEDDSNIIAAAGQMDNSIVRSMVAANQMWMARNTLAVVKSSAATLQRETEINAAFQLATLAIETKVSALQQTPEHKGSWGIRGKKETPRQVLRALVESWALFQLRVLGWSKVDFDRFAEFVETTNAQFVERQIDSTIGGRYLDEQAKTNLRLQVLDKIQAQKKDEFGFYAGVQPQPRTGQQPAPRRSAPPTSMPQSRDMGW